MDDKLERISKSLEDLKRQVMLIQQKMNQQDLMLMAIAKDLGSSDSKNLSDVIYKMDSYMSRDATEVTTMNKEVSEIRRMTTSIELMVKDVMKGMSVIYSSVDELEESLLPERETK